MTRLGPYLAVALLALAACSERPERAPVASEPPASGALTPALLWAEIRSLHASATLENREATGRRFAALLTEEALAAIGAAIPDEASRYMALGRSAVERHDYLKDSEIEQVWMASADRAVVRVRGAYQASFQYRMALERGRWKLLLSDSLPETVDEFLPVPRRRPGVPMRRPGSLEELAVALVEAYSSDDAWGLHDLVDSRTRAYLLDLHDKIGAPGTEEAVRTLQFLIRNSEMTKGLPRLRAQTAHSESRGEIQVEYFDGSAESFSAVREDGRWYVQLMQ